MTTNSPTHPDQRFVDALLANDHDRIREIYSRFSEKTLKWVRLNSGTADDARDVFQEALLSVTLRARKGPFRLTCPFGAYLFLVVRGIWLNELKQRKKKSVTNWPVDGLEGEEGEAMVFAEETLREVQREQLFKEKFQKLSKGCRELIQLSWQGEKMGKVAEQLGLSYAYARKKKSQCIATLVKSIQSSREFINLS